MCVFVAECIKTKDDYEYVTPEGKDPTESDPLILSKIMKQRAFSVGMLILRPFEEKMTQFVRKDTIVSVAHLLPSKYVNRGNSGFLGKRYNIKQEIL